jgi:NADPH2:quinone reductase
MKGFVVKDLAHPSKIPLATDVPEPKAGKDQVIVDVYSAGLNFFDVRARFRLSDSSLLNLP